MPQKIYARVDGGASGPSSVRRRGARTPIGVSGKFQKALPFEQELFTERYPEGKAQGKAVPAKA